MIQQDIEDALQAHLQTFPVAIDIAWEDYQVQNGRPYLSPKLSSCQRRTLGAGVDGVAQYDGTYTVTVRRPADEGRQPAGQLAGALVQHFRRGAVVASEDGAPVILVDASEQPSSSYANWISVPVVVTFTATA